MEYKTLLMNYDGCCLNPFEFIGEINLINNDEYDICFQKDGITVWCSKNASVTMLMNELKTHHIFEGKSISYIFDEIVRCEFFGKIDDVLNDMLEYN